jgi:hypothetical protein
MLSLLILSGVMRILVLQPFSLLLFCPSFASELMGLATVSEMWDHLRQRYHPFGYSLYLFVVREEYAL